MPAELELLIAKQDPTGQPPRQLASPSDPLPPLPPLDWRLFAIHYSQELRANSEAQTPPVSAIIVQHVQTGLQWTFAAFSIAEQRRIQPSDFLARLPDLEKKLLQDFRDFVRRAPKAVWLHWGMRKPRFGFGVLAQRGQIHDLAPVNVPMGQCFDLANYLKRRFGEDYVPHPRLWNALKFNGLLDHAGILDEQAAAQAWAKGEYGRLIESLSCKVDGIADLYERVRAGTFQTSQEPASDASRPDLPHSTNGTDGADLAGRLEAAGLQMVHLALTEEEISRLRIGPPTEGRAAKSPRMTKTAANTKAMKLAEADPSFVHKTLREWAAAIGCSEGLISTLPFWREVAEQTGRARKGKAPHVVRLTEKLLSATADPQAELQRLIGEHQADAEPSPLETGPVDHQPRRKKARRS